MLIVFNGLHQIASVYDNDPRQQTDDEHQADLDAQLLYTEHCLIKCQNEEISGDNEVQSSFCVACLIFSSLFLREMPGPVLLNEALTNRLRATMGNIERDSWNKYH
jgi:hypothetical protein